MQNYIDQNTSAYNEIASLFSSTRQYIWKDIKPLLRFAKNGDNILDLGCGNGRLYQLFKDLSITFTGIDSSKGLIDIARESHPDAEFIVSDMRKLPLKDSSFDIAYSIAAVHHLPSDGQKEVFKEVSRVMKSGGLFIMTNWNFLGRWTKKRIEKGRYLIGDFPDHIIANFISGDKRTDEARHYWNITPEQIESMAKEFGFDVVEQYYSKNGEEEGEKEGDNLVSILRKST
jgi:ubiquinone/menaquinone biosynthesis C-methylase UbiE